MDLFTEPPCQVGDERVDNDSVFRTDFLARDAAQIAKIEGEAFLEVAPLLTSRCRIICKILLDFF